MAGMIVYATPLDEAVVSIQRAAARIEELPQLNSKEKSELRAALRRLNIAAEVSLSRPHVAPAEVFDVVDRV